MRNSLRTLLSAGAGLLLTFGSAEAALLDFSFSGTVSNAVAKGDAGVDPDASILLGRSFEAKLQFDTSPAIVAGTGSVTVDLTGAPGYLPTTEDPSPGLQPKTFLFSTEATLSLSGGTYLGQIKNPYGPALSFSYVPASSSASLMLDIPEVAVGRADSPGTLDLTLTSSTSSLTVAAVPLPATLPLLGLALAGLAVGHRRRRPTTVSRSGTALAS